eukprot:4126569-Amphidinium_carterae.1
MGSLCSAIRPETPLGESSVSGSLRELVFREEVHIPYARLHYLGSTGANATVTVPRADAS